MNSKRFQLFNSQGDLTRVVEENTPSLHLIYRFDNRRIEFVSNVKFLIDEGIEYVDLGGLKKTAKNPILKGEWGHVEYSEVTSQPQAHIEAKEEEEEKDLLFFMKRTSAVFAASLAIIFMLGWLLKPKAMPEARIVTVFEQPKEVKKPVKTVSVSKEKIIKTKRKVKVAKQNKVVKTARVTKRKVRKTVTLKTGDQLKRMGALAALGGFSPNSTGSGGKSATKSKSSGFGFDSAKAKGGHARALVGKGLVSSGVGSSGSVAGYDGIGTRGAGSGQQGYGSVRMAGRSGGYYLPLSEEATVVGGLDRDQINAVVQRNLGQVIYCYEQGLQSAPSMNGRVSVYFEISPNGRVSLAKLHSSSVDSSKVEGCIVNKLRAWRFPQPKGNVKVSVTYPFVLKRMG
ncbi:MAG: hypothetical protein COT74_14260 [Bdellovibrionales bacterium CG10_big_fil_rev_8_21_14_0_10_45_34]|nr:MAG: hypothetical protein COT74_14260 [Bdellovibrionales bacterium CG10_big_fil_rev_8_21_14_0_10_45_34]